MSAHDVQRTIGAEITYQDHLAMLVTVEPRRPRASTPVAGVGCFPSTENHRDFAINCYRFGSHVVRNCERFHRANSSTRPDPLSEHLFNPVHFYGLCGLDDLILVLVDDLDAVQQVLTEATGKLGDVSVGFCPTLESFWSGGTAGPLCEVKELIDPDRRRWNDKTPMREMAAQLRLETPVPHRKQLEKPLLVFTKYKMYGLASIGQGLLVQQAMFKAMAKKVDETVRMLRGSSLRPIIEPAHLDAVSCSFLDLTGAEEIGTLIMTRNYSVAMSLVLGMKSLTFEDLFGVEPTLRDLLTDCPVHRTIITQLMGTAAGTNVAKLLRSSHIFQWTHSSLAVSPHLLLNGDFARCDGYVEAATQLQVAPGHHASAEETVRPITPAASDLQSLEQVRQRGYHGFLVGSSDLILFHGLDVDSVDPASDSPATDEEQAGARARRCHLPLLPTQTFIKGVKSNFERIDQRPHPNYGSDVYGASNVVVIPVPRITITTLDGYDDAISGAVRSHDHFAPLFHLLPTLSNRLCEPLERLGDKPAPRSGRLSMQRLTKQMADAGVPISLRRSIRYIYRSFATTLSDPCMFDVVLDLYDTFATLHAVLTEHLPELGHWVQKFSPGISHVLCEDRTGQLSRLVEAMQNALLHRTAKSYPDIAFWDMAREFRGGLNQIVLAADAPIKCGLGVARLYATSDDVSERTIDRLGVFAKIGPIPGVSCHSLNLGTEDKARLAFFTVDIPHVVHVASYYDFAHEGCHLVFYAMAEAAPGEPFFSVDDPYISEWISETFSTLLGQVLVFGTDVKAALFNCVASYSRSIASVGQSEVDAVVRFTELLIKCFLVFDPFYGRRDETPGGDQDILNDIPILDDLLLRDWADLHENMEAEAAWSRFEAMVKLAGPLFCEYKAHWESRTSDAVWNYTKKQFLNVYGRILPFMPELWRKVREVWVRYRRYEVFPDGENGRPSIEQVVQEIDRGLEEGRPFLRGCYRTDEPRLRPDGSEFSDQDRYLSRPFLVFAILRRYIRTITRAMDNGRHLRLHLGRDQDGLPMYGRPAATEPPWFEFQCETGRTPMYSASPRARAQRLRKQIAAIKTFWDVSSNLRARRLYWMFEDNFGEQARNRTATPPDAPAKDGCDLEQLAH
jgi:hypothetical protein